MKVFKKAISLMVVVTLLFALGIVLGTTVSAGSTELIQNGYFESITDGMLDGWELIGASNWTDVLVTDQSSSYSPSPNGGNYLYFGTAGTAVKQEIRGLNEFTTYNCTLYVRTSADYAAQVSVTAGHWDDVNSVMIPLDTYQTNNGIAVGKTTFENNHSYWFRTATSFSQWLPINFSVSLPKGGNMISLSLVANKASIYFDGFKMEMAQNLVSNGELNTFANPLSKGKIVGGVPTDTTVTLPFAWRTGDKNLTIIGTESGYEDGDFLKVNRLTASSTYYSQSIMVKKGYNYKLSFRAKAYPNSGTFAEGAKPVYVKFEYKLPDGSGSAYAVENYFTATGEWAEYSIKFSENHPAEFSELTLMLRNAITNSTVCYDNVKIEYDTSALEYYDNNGDVVNSLPTEGATITVKGRFVPQGTEIANISMISALYKMENGKAILVQLAPIINTLTSNGVIVGEDSLTASIIVPKIENDDKYYISTFLWDGLSSMKPYIKEAKLSMAN